MRYIALLFWLFFATFGFAQSPEITFSTKNETDNEKAVVGLMKDLLKEYDLSKWIFTDKVMVEAFVIPHSHPILTLNTRYGKEEKDQLLTTFIHEQLHWYLVEHDKATDDAIAQFRKKYKDVPYKNRAGARDEHSTYLHLIVCYLEYRSMASLIGQEEAKQLMWNQTHYTWIYNKIIEDAEYIAKVLKKHNLNYVE